MYSQRYRAKAKYTPGKMNKLETSYSEYLQLLKGIGKIKEYHFESVKLKIGANCTYCPDFLVITADDILEFHEVKGTRGAKGKERPFYYDDAMVKLKSVADKYPFVFYMCYKQSGDWVLKEI